MLLASLVVQAALASVGIACSTGAHEGTVGLGDPCEVATDCQEGTVCITQKTGARECCDVDAGQCDNDLSSIQSSEVDAGEDGAASAAPPEAAAPAQEAAAPAPEAAAPAQEAAAPAQDASTPPAEAGGTD